VPAPAIPAVRDEVSGAAGEGENAGGDAGSGALPAPFAGLSDRELGELALHSARARAALAQLFGRGCLSWAAYESMTRALRTMAGAGAARAERLELVRLLRDDGHCGCV
jgi:hypothetical protein